MLLGQASERVAAIHETRGETMAAAIVRLSPLQALRALLYLSGLSPDETRKAIDHVRGNR